MIFYSENMKEKCYWRYPDMDGRIILKGIYNVI
jgi:hypothetical protein